MLGGASPVRSDSDIHFEFGKLIVVDDVLMDYSGINTTSVEVGEEIFDLGPFEAKEVPISPSLKHRGF